MVLSVQKKNGIKNVSTHEQNNLYINDEMIKMGHGYEYYGKTKKI